MNGQTLGLYLQVPFCASKCTFCNFSSRVRPSSEFDTYCDSLNSEFRLLSRHLPSFGLRQDFLSRRVDSVYMGGGTPSLLGEQKIRGLVGALRLTFNFTSSPEFTVEVTPGSADHRLLGEMLACGVNRLSIGAQSFSDRELSVVGRLHSAEETAEQVQRARCAGFRQISLDLIAGLPHQTEESWRESLDRSLDLRPDHISIYLFEADDRSRLGREIGEGGVRYHAESVPDAEFMASAYEEACRRLSNSGYGRYEISNFALPGHESQHNRKYWKLDPYLGLGAGAHSFDGLRRWFNVEDVEEYESRLARGRSPVEEIRLLTDVERIEEFFFLGLRQRIGVQLDDARERWGERRLEPWQVKIESLVKDGWLEMAAGRVRLADRALLVSNEIFQEFVAV